MGNTDGSAVIFAQPPYGVHLSFSGGLRDWISLCFHRWMCLVFLRGRRTLDFDKCSFFCSSLSLFMQLCRVNSDFAQVLGGRSCGTFMSPLFRDPHPTCVRCGGTKCSADMTCDICKDWSVAQWGAFLKRRPYSERRKKHPSGSALPSAPPTIPPSV